MQRPGFRLYASRLSSVRVGVIALRCPWAKADNGSRQYDLVEHMPEKDLETRIRERAYRIWKEGGSPDGQAAEHWELAKFAIAQEDAQATMLQPVDQPAAEPIEAVANQGEFPTLTDQGEQQIPSRRNTPPNRTK